MFEKIIRGGYLGFIVELIKQLIDIPLPIEYFIGRFQVNAVRKTFSGGGCPSKPSAKVLVFFEGLGK